MEFQIIEEHNTEFNLSSIMLHGAAYFLEILHLSVGRNALLISSSIIYIFIYLHQNISSIIVDEPILPKFCRYWSPDSHYRLAFFFNPNE